MSARALVTGDELAEQFKSAGAQVDESGGIFIPPTAAVHGALMGQLQNPQGARSDYAMGLVVFLFFSFLFYLHFSLLWDSGGFGQGDGCGNDERNGKWNANK